MNKLDIKNIFIKDQQNNFYRICGISNPTDSRGEKYIKLVFPDLKDVPLIGETNDALMKITKSELLKEGILEFSYHYRGGVSHYKEPRQKYIDRQYNLPKIDDKGGLHLLILKIHSLTGFKANNKSKIKNGDIVLRHSFNDKSREISFMLLKDSHFKIKNIKANSKTLKTYKVRINDNKICLGIYDVELMLKPEHLVYGVQLFRYDDPTLFLE